MTLISAEGIALLNCLDATYMPGGLQRPLDKHARSLLAVLSLLLV